MAHLLDVNLLIALMDSAHVHHDAAHAWFARHERDGWLTCPLTENGAVRILANPAYPNGALPVDDLVTRLREFTDGSETHEFLPATASLLREKSAALRKLTSKNLTDAYLLRLAAETKNTLATFDRRILPTLIGEPANRKLVFHLQTSR